MLALYSLAFMLSLVASLPTLPNIGFLGSGYDMVIGNPQPSVGDGTVDHGWKLQIVNLTYTDGQTTSDQRYSIPDHTEALSESGCSFETNANINHGDQSYSTYLSQSITVSESENAIIEKESYSASSSFQSFSKSTYESGNIYVSTTGECPAYQANVEPIEFTLRDDFIATVHALPLSVDVSNPSDPYYLLIKNYGTNYATGIYMGSKYTRTFEFEEQAWTSMNWWEWDISSTASCEYAVVTESVSESQKYLVNQSYEYAQISSALYETVLGSYPPTNGNISKWDVSSQDNPYPYSYTLNGIDYLFNSQFMPTVTNLTIRQSNMVKALDNYCGTVQGCGTHSNDINPVFIQSYNESISHGTTSAECPQGYVAISCGYEGINDGDSHYDMYWSVWPANDYSCNGYNNYDARVFAVCAPKDIALGWVAQSAKYSNNVDVKCPEGHRVTGCGQQPNGGNSEKYKEVYPLSDGSGCHCYNYYGGTCWATCLSSVNNSRIYETSGTMDQIVKCEGEPIVFGCGLNLKNLGNGDYEKYPAYFANDYNSCQGYSYYSYNVYAICGSLGNDAGQNSKIHKVYSKKQKI